MSLADVRDIAIIIMAGLTILLLLVLLLISLMIYRKVGPLIDRIYPVVDSVRTTATTVAGTSIFVGEAVVSPIIRVASFAAGMRRGASALVRLLQRRETGI